MAGFVIDNFIEPGVYAPAHTPPAGGILTAASGTSSQGAAITAANRMRGNAAGDQVFYYPANSVKSPTIEATLYLASAINQAGIVLRTDPTSNNYYLWKYLASLGRFTFGAYTGGNPVGSVTQLSQALSVGQRAKLKLSIDDSGIVNGSIDGIVVLSLTDTNLTAAGYVGMFFNGASADDTGIQIDSFAAYDSTSPIVPPTTAQTTGYLYTRDGHGNITAGVVLTFQLIDAKQSADEWSTSTFNVTSDANGLIQTTLIKGARYSVKLSTGTKETVFKAGTGSTYAIPEVMGG